MTAIVSFIFRTYYFPHDEKIVTINQLSFVYASPNASIGPLIPMIEDSQPTTENISVVMYSSLMGTFKFMAPVHHIYTMSSRSASLERFVPFCTSYFDNTRTLHSLNASCEG
jgi:hypothetical protein